MAMRDYDGAISRLRYWCQTVLPAVYDDSLSYYELVAKMVTKINEVVESENKLAGYVAENTADIKELQDLFQKFIDSGYKDYYYELLADWFDKNAFEIYKLVARQVFFGLTDDGYFCAYVPDSWSEIEFDTGANYGTYTYGHLILRYNVDGSGVIDNTEYGESITPEQYKELKDELERVKTTLYTALNRGE